MASPLNGTLSVLRMERVRPLTRNELHDSHSMIRNPRTTCKKRYCCPSNIFKYDLISHISAHINTKSVNYRTFLHPRWTTLLPKLNHQRATKTYKVWWHAQHENVWFILQYWDIDHILCLWPPSPCGTFKTCLSFSGRWLNVSEPSFQPSHFSIILTPRRSSQEISSNQNHIISHRITSHHSII